MVQLVKPRRCFQCGYRFPSNAVGFEDEARLDRRQVQFGCCEWASVVSLRFGPFASFQRGSSREQVGLDLHDPGCA